MSWLQCSKKRQGSFSANFHKQSSMTCKKETLAGGLIILALLMGVLWAFYQGQGSPENMQDAPRGNFLARAATPFFTDVYMIKKVERNGKKLAYIIKPEEKGNLNSNKNHPSKIPLSISSEN